MERRTLNAFEFQILYNNNQHLSFISSYNRITDLPQDIFIQMPSLNSLYLTGNPLHVIDEATFKPIWYQLKLFFFHGKLILNSHQSQAILFKIFKFQSIKRNLSTA